MSGCFHLSLAHISSLCSRASNGLLPLAGLWSHAGRCLPPRPCTPKPIASASGPRSGERSAARARNDHSSNHPSTEETPLVRYRQRAACGVGAGAPSRDLSQRSIWSLSVPAGSARGRLPMPWPPPLRPSGLLARVGDAARCAGAVATSRAREAVPGRCKRGSTLLPYARCACACASRTGGITAAQGPMPFS